MMSRPQFLEYEGEYADSSYLNISQGVHPCVTLSGPRDFVPNDTIIDPNQG